jgi:hypothetical protein
MSTAQSTNPVFDISAVKNVKIRFDPYSAGIRAYRLGRPLDPDFGRNCKGWGTNSAQCLYERGRLAAAAQPRTRPGALPSDSAARTGGA